MKIVEKIEKMGTTLKKRGTVLLGQIFPKEEPLSTLTPLGRQLYFEARRKEALLREQQQNKQVRL